MLDEELACTAGSATDVQYARAVGNPLQQYASSSEA
jgi:hypothetical protein